MAKKAKKTTSNSKHLPSWQVWQAEHGVTLAKLTPAQKALLEAAVRFVAEVEGEHIMVRLAGFFLLHAGMGLSPAHVGAAIGRTDRAMRTVQALGARELLESIWGEMGRHRKPKLAAEHAGPIALYMVEHPRCTQFEMVSFIERSFGIKVDPLTLRRFFKTYGLGVLRDDRAEEGTEARPFDSAVPASAAHSYSSRRRSR
jgi:transposase